MKIRLLILNATALFSCALGTETIPRLQEEYNPKKWPEANLKLSSAGTLKEVFDSGLRPYHVPGLENTTLELKHLVLFLELGSGKRLPETDAELVRIKPFPDGEIATLEAFTPKLTSGQAGAEMQKWLPHGTNGRSKNDLRAYLEAVDADYLEHDDPFRGIPHGCSVIWKEPAWKTEGGGAQIVAWFRKTSDRAHPLRLCFKLSWSSNRPQKNRGSYHPFPIPPPLGYEHVDMTAPENFGPDSAVDILEARESDRRKTPSPRSKNSHQEGSSKGPAPINGKKHPQKRIAAAFVLLMIALAYFYFSRRGRAQSSSSA